MGPETFEKYEIVKQRGDDGLPCNLLQIDIEEAGDIHEVQEKRHIARIFVPIEQVKQLFAENNV